MLYTHKHTHTQVPQKQRGARTVSETCSWGYFSTDEIVGYRGNMINQNIAMKNRTQPRDSYFINNVPVATKPTVCLILFLILVGPFFLSPLPWRITPVVVTSQCGCYSLELVSRCDFGKQMWLSMFPFSWSIWWSQSQCGNESYSTATG
jgi:hypothetical protein